jgi:hypothetical protein
MKTKQKTNRDRKKKKKKKKKKQRRTPSNEPTTYWMATMLLDLAQLRPSAMRIAPSV